MSIASQAVDASAVIPSGFKIISQEHLQVPQPDGTMGSEWTIRFETPSGVRSFITVPDVYYTADNVGAEIAQRVREIEQVHALGAGDHQ